MIRSVMFSKFIAVVFMCAVAGTVQAQDIFDPLDQFGFKDNSARKGQERLSANVQDYGAPPMRWHGFSITPRVTSELAYQSNIFGLENGEVSDFVTHIKPSLRIDKNIGRHSFSLNAEGDGAYFADYRDENKIDGRVLVSSRLEAYHNFIIPLELSYRQAHVSRNRRGGKTMDDLTTKPLAYDEIGGHGGFVFKSNRLAVSMDFWALNRRYDNGLKNDGSLSIGDDGDFNRTYGRVKISYDTSTSFMPFIEGRIEHNDFQRLSYEDGSGYSGNDRSHDVSMARLGFSFDYKGLVSGSIAAGQEKRSYDQADIKSSTGFSMAGALSFVFSPKWKSYLDTYSYTDEDTILNAGVERLGFNLSTDYELQRDLFTFGQFGYEEEDYDSLNRTDETILFGGGLRYIISPGFQLSAEYMNQSRDSNGQNTDMNDQIFMIRAHNSL